MLRSGRGQPHQPVVALLDHRRGQVWRQRGATADRPRAGAAAAVRRAEALVQVEMHDVEAEVAVPHAPHDRVEVGAVAVQVGPGVVHQRRDLLDAALPQPQRVRRGDHDRRDRLVQLLLDARPVERAVGGGQDGRDREAGHRRRRRVGAVRRVGHQDATPRRQLPAVLQRARDHQHAGQLALRARRRGQADRRQPRDRGQRAAQLEQRAQRALRLLGRGLRMRAREARQRRHQVVDLGGCTSSCRSPAGRCPSRCRSSAPTAPCSSAPARPGSARAGAARRAAGGRRAAASAARSTTARRPPAGRARRGRS